MEKEAVTGFVSSVLKENLGPPDGEKRQGGPLPNRIQIRPGGTGRLLDTSHHIPEREHLSLVLGHQIQSAFLQKL